MDKHFPLFSSIFKAIDILVSLELRIIKYWYKYELFNQGKQPSKIKAFFCF